MSPARRATVTLDEDELHELVYWFEVSRDADRSRLSYQLKDKIYQAIWDLGEEDADAGQVRQLQSSGE
jgi:hypothetical protein